MLTNILNLENVTEMSKNQQKKISGGFIIIGGGTPQSDLNLDCAKEPENICCVQPDACEHQ
ncbi:hypothetical protein [Tenacibaculum sp. 190524A05c]|uniref:hypothetical protein n=1 Tax=Tenacibaculum platacis TaxID=3137852 RepID=UPI0032B21CD0